MLFSFMAQFCIEVHATLIMQDLVIRAGNERVINLKLTILDDAFVSVYVTIHHHQNDAMLCKRSFLHNGCFHFGFVTNILLIKHVHFVSVLSCLAALT